MPDDTDPERWLGCLRCHEPAHIALTATAAVITCPECNRQFVVIREPPGGAVEVDGVQLPPFLAERMAAG